MKRQRALQRCVFFVSERVYSDCALGGGLETLLGCKGCRLGLQS